MKPIVIRELLVVELRDALDASVQLINNKDERIRELELQNFELTVKLQTMRDELQPFFEERFSKISPFFKVNELPSFLTKIPVRIS